MSNTYDHEDLKVESTEPRPVWKKRSFRMSVLLTLILGWASLVQGMERSGTIANYLSMEILVHTDYSHG